MLLLPFWFCFFTETEPKSLSCTLRSPLLIWMFTKSCLPAALVIRYLFTSLAVSMSLSGVFSFSSISMNLDWAWMVSCVSSLAATFR